MMMVRVLVEMMMFLMVWADITIRVCFMMVMIFLNVAVYTMFEFMILFQVVVNSIVQLLFVIV